MAPANNPGSPERSIRAGERDPDCALLAGSDPAFASEVDDLGNSRDDDQSPYQRVALSEAVFGDAFHVHAVETHDERGQQEQRGDLSQQSPNLPTHTEIPGCVLVAPLLESGGAVVLRGQWSPRGL